MWQLARRRAASTSVLAVLAGVTVLLYRWWRGRRKTGTARSPPPRRPAALRRHSCLLPVPPDDARFRRHVDVAVARHLGGHRGELPVGRDGSVYAYSSSQDPWLVFVTAALSPLHPYGEAAIVFAAALALLCMIVRGYFGPAWPLIAALMTLLLGLVLAWASTELQGSVKGTGVIMSALEVALATTRGLEGAVILHTVCEMPRQHEAALRQVLYRRAAPTSQQGHGMVESFALRDGFAVLVEVDTCQGLADHDSVAPGLIGAFVLDTTSGSTSASRRRSGCGPTLHHYSASCMQLRGPAAAAAASGPLQQLLAEVQAELMDVASEQAAVDDSGPALEFGRRALERATRLSCEEESEATWKFTEEYRGMRITIQEAAECRFPMVRGIVEVSPEELAALPSGGRSAAAFASEVFGFGCSGLATQLSNPMKGDQTLLRTWQGNPSLSLVHASTRPSALLAATDGVFMHATRRMAQDNGAGDRLTCVVVPAPEHLYEPHTSKVEEIRAGVSYKKDKMLLWVLDVLPLANGGLRVACIAHLDPEVSFLLPAKIVRSALMHSCCCGSSFIEMANQ